jgi:CO dehydrogenase nickel-insertion accessory protein CooC1
MMKAETKAKRRLTLSLAGLGWPDESEVVDIPSAQPAGPHLSLAERAAEKAAAVQAVERVEAVIIDLEAGLEHLGRRSAPEVDAMLVVVDPSRASLETARRIRRLAGEIGVERVLAVGNRVRGPADVEYLATQLDGLELVGTIPYSDDVIEAERAGRPVTEIAGALPAAVARLTDVLVAMTKVQVKP